MLPAGLLIALAAAFLVARVHARSSPVWVAALFIAAQWITVLLFFQYSRFRLVSIPAMALLAAGSVDALATWRRVAPARRWASAAVATAVLVTAFLPIDDEAREQRAVGKVALAEGYRLRGDHERALALLDDALDDAPRLVRAHTERFATLRGADRHDEALATLMALAEEGDGHPLIVATLARYLAEEEAVLDLDRAVTLGRAAVSAEPTLVDGRVALATALLRSGDPGGAWDAIEPATLLPTADGEPFLLAGVALLELDRAGDAERYLRQCRDRLPGDVRPLVQLIVAYRTLGRTQDVDAVRAELRRVAPGHRLAQ